MYLRNNLDVIRAVRKVFGDSVKHHVEVVEKVGNTYAVYIRQALPQDADLPEGIRLLKDGDYFVIVFENRNVEVI